MRKPVEPADLSAPLLHPAVDGSGVRRRGPPLFSPAPSSSSEEDEAGWWSRLTFGWLEATMTKGYGRRLEPGDALRVPWRHTHYHNFGAFDRAWREQEESSSGSGGGGGSGRGGGDANKTPTLGGAAASGPTLSHSGGSSNSSSSGGGGGGGGVGGGGSRGDNLGHGRVYRSVGAVVGRHFAASMAFILVSVGSDFCNVIFVNRLIAYLEASSSSSTVDGDNSHDDDGSGGGGGSGAPSLWVGLRWTALLTLSMALNAVVRAHAMYWCKLTGIKLRNIVLAAVMDKVLRLGPRGRAAT